MKMCNSNGIIIKTKRLTIYPASNEQMEQTVSEEPVPELKEAYRQMLDGSLSHPEERQWYALWNIELNGTVIGKMSFMGLGEDGILEIGYGMNVGYEGHGYMTEAVSAVVRWAAVQNGIKGIEAETVESNIASARLLQKAGFVPNGKTGEEGPRYVFRGTV